MELLISGILKKKSQTQKQRIKEWFPGVGSEGNFQL